MPSICLHFCLISLLEHLTPDARASSQNSLPLTFPSPVSSPTHRAMILETWDSNVLPAHRLSVAAIGPGIQCKRIFVSFMSLSRPCKIQFYLSPGAHHDLPISTYICTYTYICMHTHAHVFVYTHTHTHTHTHRVPSVPDLHAFASATPIDSLGFSLEVTSSGKPQADLP